MLDLAELLESLRAPDPANDDMELLSAYPIPGFERHRLAKNAEGAPAILISAGSGPMPLRPASSRLEHIEVRHDAECRVSRPGGGTETGRFTILGCKGADRALHVYFLRVAAAVVLSLGVTPTGAEIQRAVDRLAELFRAMKEPPRKSVQGLWAELFAIARSSNPAVLVDAWHATPEDRYDFCRGDQRIEVKSASNRVRQHSFSLEQLYPPKGTRLLIASVFVERAGAGTSVAELVDRIRSCISTGPDLLAHVDRIVGLTLGQSWRAGLEERFDWELAQESLRFFEPDIIPKPGPDLPSRVTEVRFKSNLTGLPVADLASYRTVGDIFLAALG